MDSSLEDFSLTLLKNLPGKSVMVFNVEAVSCDKQDIQAPVSTMRISNDFEAIGQVFWLGIFSLSAGTEGSAM
jgi:hypothetical protein